MCLLDSHWKLFTRLFKCCCPLLEDLNLSMVLLEPHVVEILCPNLKRFELDADLCDGTIEFVISAPKLENMSIFSYTTWFRFLCKPWKLAECILGMWHLRWRDEEVGFVGKVSQAFKAISSVRSLKLYGIMLQYICYLEEDDALPVFHNLTVVRIDDFYFTELGGLLAFLHHCPNLEVLVLCMGSERDHENVVRAVLEFVPPCVFTKLRVLELKVFRGTNDHLQFMEYMLRSGKVLEKLLVGVVTCYSGDEAMAKENEFCKRLFSYPRNSSVCEIQFTGEYISAASKGLKHGILECVSNSLLQVQ